MFANSGAKIHGGILRSERKDLCFMFPFGASFSSVSQSALEKIWGTTFWGAYPFLLAAPSSLLAAAALAGEAAGLSTTHLAGRGLARNVRRQAGWWRGCGPSWTDPESGIAGGS